jgi:hypothetical protein
VTKPDFADGAGNLELEAATQTTAADALRRHGVISLDHVHHAGSETGQR